MVTARRLSRLSGLAVPAAAMIIGLVVTQSAGVTRAGAQAVAQPAVAKPAFSQTKTITRTELQNGQTVVVDKRTVTLTVNVTTNLFSQQVVTVNWTGAHPSGGIEPDPNNSVSQQEEYPMVLLECHGDASPSAPAAKQITPEDCWTSTPSERYFSSNDEFPPWRLDQYATAAGQRNLVVNEPSTLPAACSIYLNPNFVPAQYWLPYATPTGQKFSIGPAGCAGTPDEMSNLGGLGSLPSNEAFAGTDLDGRGSDNFDIWTSLNAPDLGCSQTVSCALVAVPIMGISCDPVALDMPPADQPTAGTQEQQAAALCEQTGAFAPGSRTNAGSGNVNNFDQSVSGELWWAASNWRNRFVVPLTFAPPSNLCSIVSKTKHFIQVYGSELLDQLAPQWQPHFCLNSKLFTLDYVASPEPEAASELQQGEIEAALVSDQPSGGFSSPVVHAPVAVTGFAISFVIDNAQGVPIATLRLDPRLLAKLLTESYPAVTDIASDPELLHPCPGIPVAGSTLCTNPQNITQDPEFRALNPGVPEVTGYYAAATLLALSTNSDVMEALTTYINDNAAARAWLNGKPDPWGMTVNSAYKGIKLPVSSWPLASTFEPPSWISGVTAQNNLCYYHDPSPVLPLIAAPVPDLPDIATDIEFGLQQAQVACPAPNPSILASLQLSAIGAEAAGNEFMIGVTSLADADRLGLQTAALLTHTAAGTPAKFGSDAGMTFVAPSSASLETAATLLAPVRTQDDWQYPYALYGGNSVKVEKAYPGTMMVYADIPTKGLDSSDAADYATLLRYAATTGQTDGNLPAGYLPMTAANHLGNEAAYTLADADAVAAQKGNIPALLAKPAKAHKPKARHPRPSPSATSSTTSPAASTSTASPTASPTTMVPVTSSPAPPVAARHYRLAANAQFGVGGWLLPAVGAVVLAGLVAVGVSIWLGRSRGKQWS
jgi:hypothetical protein